MSSVYNLEPQPNAKVILKTTAGDILLEIFGKQTPLASKNFLQHCYDGYYNNTIFHRLVPGFIIQGGDPTGTGTGGVSSVLSDEEYFQDEFHSRLKFNRRGLLGMANEGREGTNGSQFFFTLAATPELQGRNTMFGRVEGDTIYNLMKMADAEVVEGTERPLYPTKITGTEVLVNPFDDVFARVKEAPRVKEDEGKKEVKKRKKAAGKNVLSFGDDEDGDVEMAAPVLKKAKANPKLVVVENDVEESAAPGAAKEKKAEKPRKRRTPSPSPEPATESVPPKKAAAPRKPTEDDSRSSSSPEPEPKKTALDKTNAEIAALKASMKRTVDAKPEKATKPKNALEAMIPATSTKGRKRGKVTDDKGAMDFFNAWKARLESAPDVEAPGPAESKTKANGHVSETEPTAAADAENDDDEAALCDLHFIANCQSCRSWDEDGGTVGKGVKGEAEMDGDDDPGWMSHRLTAAKDTLGKDLEWKRKMEEVEVIDPREKARVIKEERRKERDGGRNKG